MTVSLKGIAVSNGIAIGPAHRIERGLPEVAESVIIESQIEHEVNRLSQARTIARSQLKQIKKRIPRSAPTDIVEFIDTHLLMMDDSALSEAPAQLIRTKHCSAEWALKLQLDTLVEIFDEMDDPYLKTRRDDVVHVVNRILRILMEEEFPVPDDMQSVHNRIIVADDLTPADIVLLQQQGMTAFITESGGPLSHTAILARSLNLPAIVGVRNAKRYLRNEENIILDGDQGVVLTDFDSDIEQSYRKLQQNSQNYRTSLNQLKDKPSRTLDKIDIELYANAELPEEIAAVLDTGIHGIGLFRTEYLYMNRDIVPDEEEQYLSYTKIIETMGNYPVTIRTLDLGADKPLKSMQYGDCPTNPALGLRAVRLCLNDPELFRPQLRAILRASANGSIRIMIPMLSNTREVTQVLDIIEDVKQELLSQGYEFDNNVAIGGMIEVPAAAISADLFAARLDFLSIGTNDLIQYTLAIDRIDEEVNYLYKPSHPSVLKLIHMVIEAGKNANIPVSMCGEMAGDKTYTRLLLGLGLRQFSMQTNAILEIKDIVNHSNVAKLEKASLAVLQCEDAEQALERIEELNKT